MLSFAHVECTSELKAFYFRKVTKHAKNRFYEREVGAVRNNHLIEDRLILGLTHEAVVE